MTTNPTTSLDVREAARIKRLLAQATPAPWMVYSEPDVGLPASLFAGTPMVSGFGPIEPLSGTDMELIAALRNHADALLALTTTPLAVEYANNDPRVSERPSSSEIVDEAIEGLRSDLAGLAPTRNIGDAEAREALQDIASGEAFRCQRFAEDDDAEYFLRAQRAVVTLARAALTNPPKATCTPPVGEPE